MSCMATGLTGWKHKNTYTYNFISSSFNPHKAKNQFLISEIAWEVMFLYYVCDPVEVNSKATTDFKVNKVELGILRTFPN